MGLRVMNEKKKKKKLPTLAHHPGLNPCVPHMK
jgi:hypothetical protein